MAMWSPWRGCRKYSEGCKYCYIHKGDEKRGVDTGEIVKGERFWAPIEKNKNGSYKIKAGQTVYLCFSTDFLIEEADQWRDECWKIMRQRPDLTFLFLTKRIERLESCLPPDWGDGYDNVVIGCTVENQDRADYRLPIFTSIPIKHRYIICQPMLENIDLSNYLDRVELVVAGGESDVNARPLNFDWVLNIREQCAKKGTHFEFRQCGTHFIKDGLEYTLNVRQLCSQARKADINL